MVLHRIGDPLRLDDLPDPLPGPGEIRVKIEACGVCRTDLHVVDGDLALSVLPIVPGHEIVGTADLLGPGVTNIRAGMRIGIPWLGHTCGTCRYCRSAQENLCDRPLFTGYTRNGGYATHVIADARYAFVMPSSAAPVELAPLLCAGMIGWRSLVIAGSGQRLGLYGFGAAAHIVAQVARWQGRRVFAFTRTGDLPTQEFARQFGAEWAGNSDEMPPEELDAAIIYAPVGALVPLALKAVRKGGRVVCAGIHMSPIPSFPYQLLWGERQLVSVANLTRQDGRDFFEAATRARIRIRTVPYPLERANDALADLRAGRVEGAAVLIPST